MNDAILPVSLTIVLSYLLGSINSALIVSRLLYQDDIRRHGSGNAGVTNMYRIYGRGPALITVLGDFSKAVLAVLIARVIFVRLGVAISHDPGYLAGLFALIGHIFPLYFKFKGGKGVMPLIGVLILVSWQAFAVVVLITLPVVLLTRKMSLGSIVGSIVLPFATFGMASLLNQNALAPTVYAIIFALIVIVAHRSNIKRLLAGTEKPVFPKSP